MKRHRTDDEEGGHCAVRHAGTLRKGGSAEGPSPSSRRGFPGSKAPFTLPSQSRRQARGLLGSDAVFVGDPAEEGRTDSQQKRRMHRGFSRTANFCRRELTLKSGVMLDGNEVELI